MYWVYDEMHVALGMLDDEEEAVLFSEDPFAIVFKAELVME